jgi:hypothetical protein
MNTGKYGKEVGCIFYSPQNQFVLQFDDRAEDCVLKNLVRMLLLRLFNLNFWS